MSVPRGRCEQEVPCERKAGFAGAIFYGIWTWIMNIKKFFIRILLHRERRRFA